MTGDAEWRPVRDESGAVVNVCTTIRDQRYADALQCALECVDARLQVGRDGARGLVIRGVSKLPTVVDVEGAIDVLYNFLGAPSHVAFSSKPRGEFELYYGRDPRPRSSIQFEHWMRLIVRLSMEIVFDDRGCYPSLNRAVHFGQHVFTHRRGEIGFSLSWKPNGLTPSRDDVLCMFPALVGAHTVPERWRPGVEWVPPRYSDEESWF